MPKVTYMYIDIGYRSLQTCLFEYSVLVIGLGQG